LPKDTSSELAGLFPHYSFNAERQAGKQLCMNNQLLKSFGSDSTRKSNPDLATASRPL